MSGRKGPLFIWLSCQAGRSLKGLASYLQRAQQSCHLLAHLLLKLPAILGTP